jgi:hypothetical protein
MSPLIQTLLTTAGTVITGALVFALGHIATRLVIEPVHAMRSLIGEVAEDLIAYANVIANPGIPPRETIDQCAHALRRRSSQLLARAHMVPLYAAVAKFGLLPNRTSVIEAHRRLILLSNSINKGDGSENSGHRAAVLKNLRVPEEFA